MNEKKNNEKLITFIDLLSKIDKKDLKQLKELILSTSDKNQVTRNVIFDKFDSKKGFLSLADKNKIEIIGGLPFLLNNTNYFATTESIKLFAENILNIKIPKGNKTRPELIGIIIVKISELQSFETQRINNALNAVMKNVKSIDGKNIFLEWEKAISSI
ncbi:MAG: hypothetical protein A3H98_09715 [Bacteroidetes bacterium RIFCSPLOWO2_02_FULL_36_8]|nr:MAG: hypothetical protein A3H98_09715 [Bacteroidetes bacterium RIFCSPLOWO2_02_FULL_36_8]OFY68764.1 MAG: hypothetical protein A3G23_02940 [Bacteroidetes bacterium RIFCSPLOWO2_12_FULL_37_12]